MPSHNSNWTWAPVKEGNTTVGRVRYTASTAQEYRNFKTQAAAPRTNRFGHRQINHAVGGGIQKAYVSMKLRRRMPNAQRAALAGVNVLNPGYNPAGAHKAHLGPDVFGGPSRRENLANERPSINLRGHKKIENRINRLMRAVTAPGDTSPTRTRGGLVVAEDYSNAGQPTGRTYMTSIKDHTTNTRSYHKLTFTPI